MKPQLFTLSPKQARLLILESQGLLQNNFGKGKKAVLAAIQHLRYVQIDTLAVVARAHHHTLWNRLPDYKEYFLSDLLEKDKTIFEYWSHAASYLPMSNYRFSLPRKKAYAEGKSHWFGQDKKMKKYVFDKIKSEGPLQSKDFEFKRNDPGRWYEWKPAKKALEQLFMEGKLMVAKRQGFQKVYDLTERVLPSNIDTSFPSSQEYAEHLIHMAIQSHGIVNANEVTYLQSGLKGPVDKMLKKFLQSGQLIEVMIDGLKKVIFITTPEKINDMGKLKSTNAVHILSPFDNVAIQRKRLQTIFNFDYVIECYLPEDKRKYGYFTLPVLYNDRFIARLDPKADRIGKTFYVKSIHFEKGFQPDDSFNKLLASNLKDFATFNACSKIVIEKADTKWKRNIMQLI